MQAPQTHRFTGTKRGRWKKMKMDWQPTQDGLDQILQLLRQSQSTDVQTQNHVQQRLEELNQFNDFNNYLVFVLSRMRNEGNDTAFAL